MSSNFQEGGEEEEEEEEGEESHIQEAINCLHVGCVCIKGEEVVVISYMSTPNQCC